MIVLINDATGEVLTDIIFGDEPELTWTPFDQVVWSSLSHGHNIEDPFPVYIADICVALDMLEELEESNVNIDDVTLRTITQVRHGHYKPSELSTGHVRLNRFVIKDTTPDVPRYFVNNNDGLVWTEDMYYSDCHVYDSIEAATSGLKNVRAAAKKLRGEDYFGDNIDVYELILE